MNTPHPTRDLAAFAAELKTSDIPEPVLWKARQLFAGYIATTVTAVREEPARILQRFAAAMGGGSAGVVGTALSVAPPWAALVNGSMGHMAEMDDTHRGTMSHPGDSIWAAALAVADDTTGAEEFLAAAIVGYEVSLRIGEAVMPDHYRRGWHTSGTIMAFGAAVTAARLLGLDAHRTAWALGTAAAQASGNFAHLTERAMTKDFNCGHAAKCGVVAALLAREGFSGPTDALENVKGFMTLYGGQVFPERLTAGLGQTWRISDVAHKPYSACRHIHASLDALQDILVRKNLGSDDIEHVTARIFKTGAKFVDDPQPWTEGKGLQGARFSAQFNLAVLILHGQDGLRNMMESELTLKALQDPAIREVMKRVEVVADDELEANFPHQWSSVVEVRTRAGALEDKRVDYPLGEPEFPMTDEQLRSKFDKLVALAGWSSTKSQLVWDGICRRDQSLAMETVRKAIFNS